MDSYGNYLVHATARPKGMGDSALLALARATPVDECRRALAAAVGYAPWDLSVDCTVEGRRCLIRPLQDGDEARLCEFGLSGLSQASRDCYGPYEWTSPALAEEFTTSIKNSRHRRDLQLVALEPGGRAVAHGFLWAASDPVPELGVAVADEWHGCCLGRTMLLVLEAAAAAADRHAIELTTMQTNARARRAYESVGYELVGIIRNPVGCDVTTYSMDTNSTRVSSISGRCDFVSCVCSPFRQSLC